MATILIVEDEGIIAKNTQEDLTEMGHHVIGTVKDGQKAIEVAISDMPDIILMDIVLQGDLNGIEVSKRICEMYECKIIYMTAHADEKTIEEAKKTKHVGFLHKPIELRQLQMGIERAMK
jgi:DNA-binding NtrC family response regulator